MCEYKSTTDTKNAASLYTDGQGLAKLVMHLEPGVFAAKAPHKAQGNALQCREPKQQTGELPYLVCSIISRPYAVVDEEISRQGILPMTAPVKPYTLLALTWPAELAVTFLRMACLLTSAPEKAG